MNKFCTPLNRHYINFNNKIGEILRLLLLGITLKLYEEINPEKNDDFEKPEIFGDNWSDDLDNIDKEHLKITFKILSDKKKFGFLSFKVGKSNSILNSPIKRGIQFETQNSLIYSIKNNIFDDLLIGNFMKVKLINIPSLYPDFTCAKYGDNGLSSSKEKLKYFDCYKFNSANFWIDFLKLKLSR